MPQAADPGVGPGLFPVRRAAAEPRTAGEQDQAGPPGGAGPSHQPWGAEQLLKEKAAELAAADMYVNKLMKVSTRQDLQRQYGYIVPLCL